MQTAGPSLEIRAFLLLRTRQPGAAPIDALREGDRHRHLGESSAGISSTATSHQASVTRFRSSLWPHADPPRASPSHQEPTKPRQRRARIEGQQPRPWRAGLVAAERPPDPGVDPRRSHTAGDGPPARRPHDRAPRARDRSEQERPLRRLRIEAGVCSWQRLTLRAKRSWPRSCARRSPHRGESGDCSRHAPHSCLTSNVESSPEAASSPRRLPTLAAGPARPTTRSPPSSVTGSHCSSGSPATPRSLAS